MIASFLTNQCAGTRRSSSLLTSVINKSLSTPQLGGTNHQTSHQPADIANVALLPHVCQQVRTAIKVPGIKFRYGRKPLATDHEMKEVLEDEAKMDELAYEEVRFAKLTETNSPFLDDMVEKFISYTNHDGRRFHAYDILQKAFYEIKLIQHRRWLKQRQALAEGKLKKSPLDSEEDQIILDPMEIFHRAIENSKPLVITRKVRRGGATYQVPYPLRASQSEWFAMRWFVDMVDERPKPKVRRFEVELALELIEAANNRGKVVKRRDDIHKLAQANKAYSHYRWG